MDQDDPPVRWTRMIDVFYKGRESNADKTLENWQKNVSRFILQKLTFLMENGRNGMEKHYWSKEHEESPKTLLAVFFVTNVIRLRI